MTNLKLSEIVGAVASSNNNDNIVEVKEVNANYMDMPLEQRYEKETITRQEILSKLAENEGEKYVLSSKLTKDSHTIMAMLGGSVRKQVTKGETKLVNTIGGNLVVTSARFQLHNEKLHVSLKTEIKGAWQDKSREEGYQNRTIFGNTLFPVSRKNLDELIATEPDSFKFVLRQCVERFSKVDGGTTEAGKKITNGQFSLEENQAAGFDKIAKGVQQNHLDNMCVEAENNTPFAAIHSLYKLCVAVDGAISGGKKVYNELGSMYTVKGANVGDVKLLPTTNGSWSAGMKFGIVLESVPNGVVMNVVIRSAIGYSALGGSGNSLRDQVQVVADIDL